MHVFKCGSVDRTSSSMGNWLSWDIFDLSCATMGINSQGQMLKQSSLWTTQKHKLTYRTMDKQRQTTSIMCNVQSVPEVLI